MGRSSVDVLPEGFRSAKGRRAWLREARQRLEQRRAEEGRPIPRSRPDRLRECARRLEEVAVERRAAERQDEVWPLGPPRGSSRGAGHRSPTRYPKRRLE